MEREKLKSRLGFILLSAGCAIGLGNVYKFPYITGKYGGGIFVLIYLFFLIVLGVPVMTMEFSMGRAARKSPVKLYQEIEPKGSKWHIHGKVALAGNYLLMMCYTTIAGWLLNYFVATAKGDFVGLSPEEVGASFGAMTGELWMQILFMAIVVIMAALVCFIGLQKGLERVTKVMMISLLFIMIGLAVNSLFMDGAAEGLYFYLVPNLNNMVEAGIINVIVAAMNQAFFTLSLGIGAMAIFGSYIGKERSLMGEAVNVAILDTFVALTAGLIIFPACFTYGVEVNSGFALIFTTLPNIFNNMPFGRVIGSFFFIFLSFAALSTVFAVFENISACCGDLFGWSRRKSCVINGVLLIILSLPAIFGLTFLSDLTLLGMDILSWEDFIVNYICLPLGALVFVIFCTSRYGWGWDKFCEEANTGKGIKLKRWMRPYMTYVLPAVIAVLFIIGLATELIQRFM